MRKLVLFLIYIVGLVVLSANSCYREDMYITVINNSNKAIYYGCSYRYPDTSILNLPDHPGEDGRTAYKIYPGKSDDIDGSNFVYNSTLQLFIFDADVIENKI